MNRWFTKVWLTVLTVLGMAHAGWTQSFEWVQKVSTRACGNYPAAGFDYAGNSFLFASFCDSVTIGDTTLKTKREEYNDSFLVKYDATGKIKWRKFIGGVYNETAQRVIADYEGNCYVILIGPGELTIDDKVYPAGTPGQTYVIKFDPEGKLLTYWNLSDPTQYWIRSVFVDRENFLYVMAGGGEAWGSIAKFTPGGKLVWITHVSNAFPMNITVDQNGTVYMVGISSFVNESYLYKYNRGGKLVWSVSGGNSKAMESANISIDLMGNIYTSGKFNGQLIINQDTLTSLPDSDNDIFMAKYDPEGKPIWGKVLARKGAHYSTNSNISAYESEDVYWSVEALRLEGEDAARTDGSIFVGKMNQEGVIKWVKRMDAISYGLSNTAFDPKGNFYSTGFLYANPVFDGRTLPGVEAEAQYIFLSKLIDSTFVPRPRPNRVTGKIFHDQNGNCRPDAGEEVLGNQLVKAEPGPFYTTTDSSGAYQLYLGKGAYTISQVLPPAEKAHQLWQTCPTPPGTYSVAFKAYGKDTAGFDFGNQVTRLPLLKVDVAADRRRRCFRGTTTVRYCNEGYAAAQNVQVRVYYPGYVVPISAGMAWQRQDSLLTFNVGTLAPGACGVISIADSVICGNEAIRGLTQCVKAVITPGNNNAPPDPRWDRSDVALKAACRNNGLVKLTILNTGTGNMTAAAAYRIYLDAVNVHEGPYQLASGDSLTLQVPANGRTVRLEADLSPYHPDGARKPSITLEGCGGAGPVSISKGFVNQLPPDDAQDEVAVSCLPILDSYDPNDKQATPAGVGPQHLIAPDQPLEYLVRFQNTGSDVAYTVTIADTLDANLDVATLEIGAASHPFSWSVGGVGLPVLTWTFKDINLPDSTTNEPASHGYVRFRIRPKASTPLGATIRNGAAITFDYNSPVLTNLVTHTTGTLPETGAETGVNVCSGNAPTTARAGQNVVLQEASAVALQGNVPGKGFGYWQLKSGKGTFADPTDPASLVTELGVGRNVFAWNIALCDTTSTSLVTIERVVVPAPPLVNPPAPYCAEEPMAAVTATGADLRWYADRTLAKQLGTGPSYQPVTGRSDTLYVTQTVAGYQSLPAAVRIAVKPPVPAPRVDPAGYLCNGTLLQPIHAEGETIRWYADAAQTKLLHEGSTFGLSNPGTGTLYVTQAVNGCRSEAAAVTLHAGAGDLKGAVLMPNVITPNGDGYNDAFRPPVFAPGACIGSFRTIQVHNRWGKVVFSSTDPHFAWRAEGCPGGMYFYEIRYSNFSLRGGLSILY